MRSLQSLVSVSFFFGSIAIAACGSSSDTTADPLGGGGSDSAGTGGAAGKGGTTGKGGSAGVGVGGTGGSGTAGTGTAGASGKGGSGTAGKGTAGTGTAGTGTAGSGTAGTGTAGKAGSGGGAAGSGTAGKAGSGTAGKAGSGTAGSGTAGSGTAGSGTAGSGTAGSGTAGSGTAGASGAGGAGSCDVGACGQADCQTCQQCAFTSTCMAETATCQTNPACLALNSCLNACTTAACQQMCNQTNMAGVADLQALATCIFQTACPTTCANPCPGGAGGAAGAAGTGGAAGAAGSAGAAGMAGMAAVCDPVQQTGCPGGNDKCTAAHNLAAMNATDTSCQPVMSMTVNNGATCTRTSLGTDNCKAGAVCTATGVADSMPATPHRVCQVFCAVDGDCANGEKCSGFTADGFGICIAECAPFAACPVANQTCADVQNDNDGTSVFLSCHRMGTVAIGAACTTSFDCKTNSFCGADPNMPNNGICKELCDGTHACTMAGQTCSSTTAQLGVCK